MEGLENPAARSLRVMRFNFETNESLRQGLSLLLHEKRRQQAPFHFYASRQIAMSLEEFNHNEADLLAIGRRFRSFYEPIHLRSTIASHEINEHTTRFGLFPVNQSAFDAMTSIEPVRENTFDYRTRPLTLPNRIEGQPEHGHYMFVDIATEALLAASQRKMAEKSLVGRMAMNRYWLYTASLNTVRDIHYRPSDTSPQSEDTPQTPDEDNHLRNVS